MFFQSLIKTLNSSYSVFNSAFNDNSFDKVNPNIVKYFRNEYGANWKTALEHHLYQKRVKNDKKAA